jgi:hypothetical protein
LNFFFILLPPPLSHSARVFNLQTFLLAHLCSLPQLLLKELGIVLVEYLCWFEESVNDFDPL